MPANPSIDPQVIEGLRALSPEGGAEFLKELVDIYLQDTPERLTELELALARQDAPTVTRAAHTIKGSSSNFGAQELARLAQEIELAGKAANLTAAASAAPGLKAEYARVAEALHKIVSGT
jgi:HPt (histidine-containing phosphotransfer) domain-containing protein